MRRRCRDPRAHEYKNYGARGISVCSEWDKSFLAFISDMGPKEDGKSLDRMDNDGDYGPDNCRWATNQEQSRNKRQTNWLTFNGRTQCLTDWAKELGIHHQTLRNRLKRGWGIDAALGFTRIECCRGKNNPHNSR